MPHNNWQTYDDNEFENTMCAHSPRTIEFSINRINITDCPNEATCFQYQTPKIYGTIENILDIQYICTHLSNSRHNHYTCSKADTVFFSLSLSIDRTTILFPVNIEQNVLHAFTLHLFIVIFEANCCYYYY